MIPPADFALAVPARPAPARPRAHRRRPGVAGGRGGRRSGSVPAAGGRRLDRLLAPANRRASRLFLRESRRKVWANTEALHAARLRGPAAYAAASPTSRRPARTGCATCCAPARSCCASPCTASASPCRTEPRGRGPGADRAGWGARRTGRRRRRSHDRGCPSAVRQGRAGDRGVVRHRRGHRASPWPRRARPSPSAPGARTGSTRSPHGSATAARRCCTLDLDVTDEQACADAVRRTREELGGLDVLVNNAGVMLLGHDRRRRPRGLAPDAATPTCSA